MLDHNNTSSKDNIHDVNDQTVEEIPVEADPEDSHHPLTNSPIDPLTNLTSSFRSYSQPKMEWRKKICPS